MWWRVCLLLMSYDCLLWLPLRLLSAVILPSWLTALKLACVDSVVSLEKCRAGVPSKVHVAASKPSSFRVAVVDDIVVYRACGSYFTIFLGLYMIKTLGF